MIRIRKPAAPRILQTQGIAARRALCAAQEAAPDDYRGGLRIFVFNDKLYRAPAVKAALRTAQHGKCAFCESSFTHISYGDVEHFRPKGGYRQQTGDVLKRPGYYWLAYEWSNLFMSCQLCNQRFKRNWFPLADPEKRARSHQDPLAREEPLLLDPGRVNPAEYLSFRQEVAYPIEANTRAEATIDLLGLNRPELQLERRKHLENVELLVTSIKALTLCVAQAGPDPAFRRPLKQLKQKLAVAVRDDAPYAAMTRALLTPRSLA